MTEATLWYREKFLSPSENVWFQKMSILPPPPQKGWEIPGVEGGFSKVKTFRKCMKCTCNWNFQEHGGGGGLRINPFHGEGMDNLWNYAIWNFGHYFHCRYNTCHSINAPNIWIFFFNAKIETKQWSQHELNIAQ